ncbi:MAG TPA: RNA polymerase sigma factor [Sedimenticola thiotaurini]|uniref:RNA polymerase sigma factor n=1 Tax=Sedimenticola thiotaurini TaxID=1543721 RepID=A0A831W3Y5_9GAMM|nr:RNA polymerase sigma factor [Sedimenticola thiotaurini]
MEHFLAGIERRALVMAELATHDREEALDLVQDTMLAFVKRYRERPQTEWPPLFHRILQNRIRDWHRRRQRRGRWWGRLRHQREEEESDDPDPIQQTRDPRARQPDELLLEQQSLEQILAALERLPLRQQQAFLLRTWEGLDVTDTARAMGCSGGSVKTHLSRAMHALRKQLQECSHDE